MATGPNPSWIPRKHADDRRWSQMVVDVNRDGAGRSLTTWGQGDYPSMALALEPAALVAVDLAGVAPGERVLDVATGTGNGALEAARRGGLVVGVDYEPALLRIARARARKADLAVGWVIGDVAALPVADGSAEVVLSLFGAMYGPDHAATAHELARVSAHGARVVIAAWVPGSFMPAMGQVVGPYLPPPPVGTGPPSRWGDPVELAKLLQPCGLELAATSTECITMDFPTAADAAEFLILTAGHVVGERGRLAAEGRWGHLQRDLKAFVDARSSSTSDGLTFSLDFLLALATSQ